MNADLNAAGAPEARPEDLALAAAGGDREAFGALVRRFEAPLVGYLTARCGDREDALELAQEAFLRAWASRERYDPRWRFSTWLYTIASRLSTSRLRKRGARPEVEGDEALRDVGVQVDPAAALAREELRAGVWGAAAQCLGEEQRAALWLRYVEDQSAAEIGAALGRGAVTVRVLLFRARERLARHLAEAGTAGGPQSLDLDAPAGRPLAREALG